MMRQRSLTCTLAAMATMFCLPRLGPAQVPAATDPGVPGWHQFTTQLEGLDTKVLAHLPSRLRQDPQVVQEVGRLLLQSIASQTIAALGQDANHPVFLPSLNFYLGGQPNADTTYRTADIDASGTYRLRGEVGSLRILRLGRVGPPPADEHQVMATPTYYDFHQLKVDAKGRYDVLLSRQKPADYQGDWWQLTSNTKQLFLRQVDYDWQTERDPTVSIERVDIDVRRPRPSQAETRQRLDSLSEAIARNVLFFIDHVENVRKQGVLNRLQTWDVSRIGGLTGQSYYEGAYELSENDALIIEAKVPASCPYWSILLTNDLFETTDWYNNQSSLNGSQARVDSDGVVRFVLSEHDPGVPNWLDPAGYRSGLIQGRWSGCSASPVPTVRKVQMAGLKSILPSDTPVITPADRQQILRDRRLALEQRPLW